MAKLRAIKSKDAVSPIVATILLTAIMVGAITYVYSVGAPLVTDFQDRSTINDVVNDFYVADSNIRATIHDGIGGTRTTQFTLDRGSLHFEEGTNASLEIRGSSGTYSLDIGTVGRLSYRLRSAMSDLSVQGSRSFTGAISQFVYTNDTATNSEIAILNYTRPSYDIYTVYLEYRPRLYIDDTDDILYLYTIRLIDEDNSFPRVGVPRITSNFVNLTIIEQNYSPGSNWMVYEGGKQITNERDGDITVKILYYYIEI